MIYKNISIIGTSHISKQSLEEIKKEFIEFNPDIIGIELDRKRLHTLLSEEKSKIRISDVLRIGIKGFLFAVIGSFVQRKLGAIVDVSPGAEMKLAYQLGVQKKAKIALIDQDIEITLKKLSKAIRFKEKMSFAKDIFKSIFFKEKMIKETGIDKFDLTKVPDSKIIKKMLKEFRKKYPGIYKVLVEERNKVMANNTIRWLNNNPDSKMLIVIGAGHEDGYFEEIKKRIDGKVDIIHNTAQF